MPDGGRLQIAVRREDVTDTGRVMDEATLLRASEFFFTTKELGMCAGLAKHSSNSLSAWASRARALRNSQ
jgi:hypothetical protein